jgi:hypothetical protein
VNRKRFIRLVAACVRGDVNENVEQIITAPFDADDDPA